MWRSGSITADSLYCQQGFDEWVSISSLAELLDPQPARSSASASPAQHPALVSRRATSASSGFFTLFSFGIFGAHAFYAGRRKQGFLYLGCLFGISLFGGMILYLIGLINLAIVLPPPIMALIFVGIFTLGDFIRILVGGYKDGQGRRLQNGHELYDSRAA